MTMQTIETFFDPVYKALNWIGAIAGGLIAVSSIAVAIVKFVPSTRAAFYLTKDTLYRNNSTSDWGDEGPVTPRYRGGRVYGAIWRQIYPVIFVLHCAILTPLWGKWPLDVARLRLERRMLGKDDEGENIAKVIKTGRGQQLNQVATFENVSDMLKLDEQITSYFRALQKHGRKQVKLPLSSLTKINVETGFVAPMFLLSGLLPRLEEDWRVVGEQFEVWQHLAKIHFPHLQDIVSLQSFLLDCWLLWGPSISLPKLNTAGGKNLVHLCDAWQDGKFVVAQYGYGDENNSICLVLETMDAEDILNHWIDRARAPGENRAAMQYPFALPASVRNGHLWFVDERFRVHKEQIKQPKGLKSSFGPAIISAGHPGWDRSFSLKVSVKGLAQEEKTEIDVNSLTERRYYSAYLWVLFVTLDQRGLFLFRSDASARAKEIDDPEAFGTWRNMLTFFEHGNIADHDSYQFLEEHLAVKTARSLWNMAEKYVHRTGEEPLFVYGGALDDLNCVICRPVEDPSNQLWRRIEKELILLFEQEKATSEDRANAIRRLILMPSDRRHPQYSASEKKDDELLLPTDAASEKLKAHAATALELVSGCHLFGVVAGYYQWLEKQTNEKPKDNGLTRNKVKFEDSSKTKGSVEPQLPPNNPS